MANAGTTQASSASETTGSPIPLSYGYVWATGKRHAYYTLQNTGLRGLDYTRVGIWLLGEGEWDGPQELWLNDQLTWAGDTTVVNNWLGQRWYKSLDYPTQDVVFNFHSGCDAVIGSGLTPSSTGPDQGVDVLFAQFPPAIQPLAFSRVAYYAIMRKQPILWQTHNDQEDPSQWTDFNPILLCRGLKCRLFDANGAVTGYAFTTNPAWHIVDLLCRRKLFGYYSLPFGGSPDALPTAVSARFDWESIYTAAQYYDGFLANGRRRFSHSNSFAQQTSLQAILSQILLNCRSYLCESQGKIQLICDKPRSSVFIASRDHILPGSWSASDQKLQVAGNRYVAKFRDLLVPACSTIASITSTGQGNPEVTTDLPHPLQPNDRIAMGGTGTIYDGTWLVVTVPAVLNVGTPEEVNPTTFTMARKGANYPAAVGAGGAVGLLYSRFKERSPEFWHKNNMLARGAIGIGIPRVRNKVKRSLDFGVCTYDQASRIARYERDRDLGFDVAPYITPPQITFRMSMFARDVNGQLAAAIQPGDRITLDDTLNYVYAGDYEVLEPFKILPPTVDSTTSDGSLALSPASGSGEIEIVLGPYNEGYMYDTSDDIQAGWPSVPGSDPGNDGVFTSIPLANGGNFVFFTGALTTGMQFQLPSTGYPSGNLLAWASPASANVSYHSADSVQLCSVDASRLLTLIYADDGGHTWGGDVNYAALTWLSPDVPTTDSHGMTWLELTLLGGETIVWGSGVLADGATISLPAGYTAAQAFASAFLHDVPLGGHIMYLAGAWVDAALGVHCQIQDHVGNVWKGNARVLVFAWKNNMGTVISETIGAGTWIRFPLTGGATFGVGSAKNLANSSTLSLPAAADNGSTLQPMVGPSDEMYTSSGGHAQGVGSCYLDQSNVVHCTFNDGSGSTWPSTADIFATYSVAATAAPAIVLISPRSPALYAGSVVAMSAQILGATAQAIIWSVDGIVGGDVLIGTIDAQGNYNAPNTPGTHTLTAASAADGTIVDSVKVTVQGSVILAGSLLNDGQGNTIYLSNGDVIYVE